MRVARFSAIVVAVLSIVPVSYVAAANQSPPFIPANAGWLTSVNYYRSMAGLAPVVEDSSYSSGAWAHSCYMTLNGISHDEVPGLPGYTTAGDNAGNNGNVAVSTATSATERSFIELWMTGPFHAIGILRPHLQRVGYGQCSNPDASRWHTGATLDVLRGLGTRTKLAAPVLFPGNGTVTSLNKFIAETPNPVTMCGWTGSAGLPVTALMPEDFSSVPSASITGPTGQLETCVLSRHNTSGTAQSILSGDKAVVVMPRSPLAPGTYTVQLRTSARSVTWSFTVDPAAADGSTAAPAPPQPVAEPEPAGDGGVVEIPTASQTGVPSGWEALKPARFVDSRTSMGATRLIGGVQKRIKLTGRLGLPDGASAVSANFTVTGGAGSGYLVAWNCATPMSTSSTLNFKGSEPVSNESVVPLDADGSVCVYSPTSVEIIIDVKGFFSAASTSRFVEVAPTRALDTRSGLGGSTRLQAGQMIEVTLPGMVAGATGVMLNVTSILPSNIWGWVTVYDCGTMSGPESLYPLVGEVRPNTVTTSLSASGTVCLYTSVGVDMVIDIFGYMVPGTTTGYTSSTPFRWADTRKSYTAMNFGTSGGRMSAGQVITMQIAGGRGVPSSAKAVSFNVTATDAAVAGYLTVYPCGSMPPTSNLNFRTADAAANSGTVALSSSGTLCLYASAPVHAIVDIVGWWQ